MRFRLARAEGYPAGLKLRWDRPLEDWPDDRCTEVERGLHRNPVRFVTHEGSIYAIKELLNDLDHFRAWQGGLEGRTIPEPEAARRWLEEVCRPALEAIPAREVTKLDPAEIFHPLLEHRWYASERAGRDLPLAEVVASYVDDVLVKLPLPDVGGH